MNKETFATDYRKGTNDIGFQVQTKSAWAVFGSEFPQRDSWEENIWEPSIYSVASAAEGVSESVNRLKEQEQKEIELPFHPEDRGKEDIRDALTCISTFENPEKDRIYRHAKQFYTEESQDLDTSDVIDVAQIAKYAEGQGHDDWLEPLCDQLEDFFDGIEESPLFLRQGNNTKEDLTIQEIREAVESRQESLQKATEEVYGSPDEEPNSRVISEAQKSYLWLLLSNSEEFKHLLPQ